MLSFAGRFGDGTGDCSKCLMKGACNRNRQQNQEYIIHITSGDQGLLERSLSRHLAPHRALTLCWAPHLSVGQPGGMETKLMRSLGLGLVFCATLGIAAILK